MSIFLNVNPKYIADAIHLAKSRVIYAAPALDEVVANALIKTAGKIGLDCVSVLLDISENVFRYGYGNIDGVTILKKNGISIKEAVGIRIGVLVCDDNGLVFTPTPLLVEAGREDNKQPNAMLVTPDQVKGIVSAIIPREHIENNQEQGPEIGEREVSSVKIEELHQILTDNPPQKFDIARKVQVFSTAIEFVELKLNGCEIQRHTVSIPTKLLVGEVDTATKRQLKAGFKIVEEGSSLSGDSIRNEVNEIRKNYTKSIPKYGNVLLKTKKKQFNEAIEGLQKSIEDFQKKVESELENEIKKSQNRLVDMLIPAVKENPPKDLKGQIQGERPTEDQAKKYIELKLEKIFPNAKDIMKTMSVDCVIKAVTYETISNEDFQSQIKEAYPLVDWDEMLEKYSAARES